MHMLIDVRPVRNRIRQQKRGVGEVIYQWVICGQCLSLPCFRVHVQERRRGHDRGAPCSGRPRARCSVPEPPCCLKVRREEHVCRPRWLQNAVIIYAAAVRLHLQLWPSVLMAPYGSAAAATDSGDPWRQALPWSLHAVYAVHAVYAHTLLATRRLGWQTAHESSLMYSNYMSLQCKMQRCLSFVYKVPSNAYTCV